MFVVYMIPRGQNGGLIVAVPNHLEDKTAVWIPACVPMPPLGAAVTAIAFMYSIEFGDFAAIGPHRVVDPPTTNDGG